MSNDNMLFEFQLQFNYDRIKQKTSNADILLEF